MGDPRSHSISYLRDNYDRFLEELKAFLQIPSISTDPAHEPDLWKAADWLAAHLRGRDMKKVEVIPEPRTHPLVYAELPSGRPNASTVLVYGHYDVQPAEPLEAWTSPPFEPTILGDNLFARGSTDMKGQILATLNAVEAVQAAGDLPVNLKFLFEGEEEIGSLHLRDFIARHRDRLTCDFSLNPDSGMIAPDLPTITYALRGLVYFELRVYGPAKDLHSGLYGGVVHNPAQALCELIAGMHDAQGRVTLPGFYNRVRAISDDERAELARLPMDAAFYLDQTGVRALWGETGFAPIERVGARPTLEVNGLYSGYTGKGAKTVLPAQAMAKISCRLVPDQDPDEVHNQLHSYLESTAPATIRWELDRLSGSPPSISDRNGKPIQAMRKALQEVWGVQPAFRRQGGSIPVVAYLQELLHIESVLTGFSLPDDRMHGPDEHLNLIVWRRGQEAIARFFYNIAEATQ